MKDALAPQGLFEDLGLKYIGPVDGHDRVGAGARADPRQALRRPRDRARADAQGLRLRRRGAPRGRPVPLPGPLRRGDRQGGGAQPDLDRRLRRRDGRHRRRAPRRRRDHRGDAAPGRAQPLRPAAPRPHLRRRDRRAARRHLGGGAGHGWAAPGGGGLRHLPQPRLRPGPPRRGAAQVRGHLRPGPRRGHRRRRSLPQRHVGHVAAPGRPGPAARGAARRSAAARAAA